MTIHNPARSHHSGPAYREASEEESRQVDGLPYELWRPAPDVFGSDEELEEFLVTYRRWRRSG